jgi:PEP-CTERM motif
MTRALRLTAILFVVFLASRFGSSEEITFLGLATPNGANPFFSPVGPLTFYDFYVTGLTDQNNMIIPGTEYIYAGYYPFEPPPYPYNLPYSPDTAEFYSTSGATFTLNTMNIELDPGIEFYGYRKGVLVDEGNTGTDVDPITGDPILNWTNIDAVVFPNVINDPDSLVINSITINASPVPEPSSFVLLGSGLTGLLMMARRKLAA